MISDLLNEELRDEVAEAERYMVPEDRPDMELEVTLCTEKVTLQCFEPVDPNGREPVDPSGRRLVMSATKTLNCEEGEPDWQGALCKYHSRDSDSAITHVGPKRPGVAKALLSAWREPVEIWRERSTPHRVSRLS